MLEQVRPDGVGPSADHNRVEPDFRAGARRRRQESAKWNGADSCRIGWAPSGAVRRRLAGQRGEGGFVQQLDGGAERLYRGGNLVADPHDVADAGPVEAGDGHGPHGGVSRSPEPRERQVAMLDRPVPRAIGHPPGAGHGPKPGGAPPPRRGRHREGCFCRLPSVPELVEHGLGGRGPSVGQLEEDRRRERAGVRVGAHPHPHLRRRGSDGLSARARGPRVAAFRRLPNDRDDPDPGLDRDGQRRQNRHLARHRTVRQAWDLGGDRDGALEDVPGHGQLDPRREAWPAPREVEVRRIGDPVVVLRQNRRVRSTARRPGRLARFAGFVSAMSRRSPEGPAAHPWSGPGVCAVERRGLLWGWLGAQRSRQATIGGPGHRRRGPPPVPPPR